MSKLFRSLFVLLIVYMTIYPFMNESFQTANSVKKNELNGKANKNSVANKKVNKWAIDPADYDNEFLPDFSIYKDVKQKKRAFFSYLKPLVEQLNKEMLTRREFVKSLSAVPTDADELKHYNYLLKRYDVRKGSTFKQAKRVLLKRVDKLPVELVLMQAANESGWGTSRFALEANNLFGQWCFKKGCGVVPRGRPDGESYEVRKFKHPIDSIRSYINNLNTGHAYADLREIRAELRSNKEALDAQELAEGLIQYSTRREEYVKEIQTMIRVNQKYIDK